MSIAFLLVCMLKMQSTLLAQSQDWITELTKDGSISVTYSIHDHLLETGEKTQMLEYKVIATTNSSVERCIAVMKDDANHCQFMDNTTVSKRIKDLSQSEWLTYYFLDTPWPMPNSDCVTHYSIKYDIEPRFAKIVGRAEPEAYPDKGVKRMQLNYSEYTFTEVGNGQVQIVMYSRTSPAVSAPDWIVKAWFPEGPANMMRGIIYLAQIP